MAIAKGDSGRSTPIQIQAEALRDETLFAPYQATKVFPVIAPDTGSDAQPDMPGVPERPRAADLAHAISLAQASGASSYRIEIAADGTISIVI